MSAKVRIDIWSDVICPWCYIGKRRLETALQGFEHADDVELHWHAFQLDPSHPQGRQEPVHDMLAKKFGAPAAQVRAMTRQVTEVAAGDGLHYALDRAIAVNTLDAHRLNRLADKYGLGGAMHERLLRAHLCEGEIVDDLDVLVRLGAEVGVPPEEAERALRGDDFAAEVADDIDHARRLGVTGVPFFVLNNAYGVSGAQPVGTFLAALRRTHPDTTSTGG